MKIKVFKVVLLTILAITLSTSQSLVLAITHDSSNAAHTYNVVYDETIVMTDKQDMRIEDDRVYHITSHGTKISGIIRIKENCNPTVYIEDLNIDNSSQSGNGIFVSSGATLNLHLIGENNLLGGQRHPNSYTDTIDSKSGGAAGIYVPDNAVLNIFAENDTAVLNVTGGHGNPCYYGSGGGAGIGTNGNYAWTNDFTFPAASGTVNVYGGTINAQGGNPTEQGGYGAGIGGGGGSGPDTNRNASWLGSLSVFGGIVNASSNGNADTVGNGSHKNNAVATNNPLGSVFVVGGQLNADHVNYWISTDIIDDWSYGEQAAQPNMDVLEGDIVYTYSQHFDGPYTSQVPTEAGTWYIKAYVARTTEWTGLETVQQFSIKKAENKWLDELDVKDFTYGDKVIMDATAAFGDVQFYYSQDKDGVYTDTVPAKAGTWYVKAVVEPTENYSGLEMVKSFKIFRKMIDEDQLDMPEINSKDDLNDLELKDHDDHIFIQGTDYDIISKQDGTNIIYYAQFKGNYDGIVQLFQYNQKSESQPVVAVSTGDMTKIMSYITLMFVTGIVAFLVWKKREIR